MQHLLGLAIGFVFASQIFAVVVVTEKGNRVPGYLVEITDSEVVIRVEQKDGIFKVERFAKKGTTVLESFKAERLAVLSPENPRAYRDYAEELIAKKDDPEARDLAIRLLVIASALDPDQLGRGCMVAASGIARSRQEERKFKSLAFLLDPAHDSAILKEAAGKAAPTQPNAVMAGGGGGKTFVAALQAYRRGQYKEASRLAGTPGVDQYFQTFGVISHAAFLQACTQAGGSKNPPDPTSELSRKILRMELDSEERLGDAVLGKTNPWGLALTPDSRRAQPPLSLNTVTEFSPKESVFVQGKWVAPAKP